MFNEMERLEQKHKPIHRRRSGAECDRGMTMGENNWTGTKTRDTTEMEISLSPGDRETQHG